VSEYQYYEFVAIDRALDDRQMGELRQLSTRADITRTSFVNEYHWGDFGGNPRAMMGRYFDAFLYLANWGTRELMFSLPARLLDLETARQYFSTDVAAAWQAGDNVVVAVTSDPEEPDGEWVDGAGHLASIIPVRAALAAGDLRAGYLAWLHAVAFGEVDDAEIEPPVPSGLTELTASLQAFAEFLRIDQDLIDIAATASAPLAQPSRAGDFFDWVRNLPAKEKDSLLVSFVQDNQPHLRAELRRRFDGPPTSTAGRRTAGALLDAAAVRTDEREQAAAAQRAAEQAARERAAAVARQAHLKSLANRTNAAWTEVAARINTKRSDEYDAAVTLLVDLGEVSDATEYQQRLSALREEHRRKPSLIARLDKAGIC
jgi:hypothetical protein